MWSNRPLPSWQQRWYAQGVASFGRSHRGLPLSTAIWDDAIEGEALSKISAALDVIAATSPEHIARLPDLVHSITVIRLPTALGAWRSDLRAIVLDRDFVLEADTTPAYLASVIVHEMTHARLERAGLGCKGTRKLRCERVCLLAERNFLARMRDAEERERLEEINQRYLMAPPEFWSEAATAARLAHWRKLQPLWRRVVYDVWIFLQKGHRAALVDDRCN